MWQVGGGMGGRGRRGHGKMERAYTVDIIPCSQKEKGTHTILIWNTFTTRLIKPGSAGETLNLT